MQRIRASILLFGLLIIMFICLRAGFTSIHKDIGHPVGDDAVVVFNANSDSKEPKLLVYDIVKEQKVATKQVVSVYIKSDYEKHDVLELSESILIVSIVTFVLYFSTYLLRHSS